MELDALLKNRTVITLIKTTNGRLYVNKWTTLKHERKYKYVLIISPVKQNGYQLLYR